jgi:hypothetical protein
MGKTVKQQTIPLLPEGIYVQRIVEEDDTYLLAWENIDDVDLDNGSIVGVYGLSHLGNVVPSRRTLEEI